MVNFLNLLKNIFTRYDIQEAYDQGNITLNEQHLTVIQNLNFTWLGIERGLF